MDPALQAFDLTDELEGASTGSWLSCHGEILESISPIDGTTIGRIRTATPSKYENVAKQAVKAFKVWRMIPAPRRGEIVRQIGEALRINKQNLGRLVSLEVGKVLSEGEVQEMIDIADFAAG